MKETLCLTHNSCSIIYRKPGFLLYVFTTVYKLNSGFAMPHFLIFMNPPQTNHGYRLCQQHSLTQALCDLQ